MSPCPMGHAYRVVPRDRTPRNSRNPLAVVPQLSHLEQVRDKRDRWDKAGQPLLWMQ